MVTKEDTDAKEVLEDGVFTYTHTDIAQENKVLKETVSSLKQEISRYRTPALMVAEVSDILNNKALIKVANGNKFLVEISKYVDKVKPGDSVLVEQKNLTVVDKMKSNRKFNVEKFVIIEKPKVSWKDVGGLDDKVREIKEVIELPLSNPTIFRKIGIQPPKGILLHGPSGTGKTLLAKAVAASTNSTFIEIVGSELVQKFIGEGAKLVKEIFELARQRAPSIVFIDELDSIAAKRIEVGTSGEREVQRTFMQLLAEIDGFDPLDDVKVIGCTNRRDILDPAVLRPGRLDRQLEIEAPDIDGITEIFKIHSKNMRKDKLDMAKLCKNMDGFSGAEIKAVCTEAGYFAIRSKRTRVTEKDFVNAISKVRQDEEFNASELAMFG